MVTPLTSHIPVSPHPSPGTVSGFDLSPMDAAFRWYPGIEAFDTDAVKATAMSAAFDVIDLDLQGRADAWGAVVEAAVGAVSAASVVHASAESEGGEGASVDGAKAGDGSGSLAAPAVSPGPVIAASFAGVGAWEVDRVVDAVAVASGVVNGIVLWWEAEVRESDAHMHRSCACHMMHDSYDISVYHIYTTPHRYLRHVSPAPLPPAPVSPPSDPRGRVGAVVGLIYYRHSGTPH